MGATANQSQWMKVIDAQKRKGNQKQVPRYYLANDGKSKKMGEYVIFFGMKMIVD